VLNGGISLVTDRFAGDPASFPFEFAATLTLDSFSVQEGSEIATDHGGITLAIGSEDGIVVTSDLSGSRISVSYGGKTHTVGIPIPAHRRYGDQGLYPVLRGHPRRVKPRVRLDIPHTHPVSGP